LYLASESEGMAILSQTKSPVLHLRIGCKLIHAKKRSVAVIVLPVMRICPGLPRPLLRWLTTLGAGSQFDATQTLSQALRSARHWSALRAVTGQYHHAVG
jgi:hypothetical protein